MITNENIILKKDNLKSGFSFSGDKETLEMSELVKEVEPRLRKIIFEEARTALIIFLNKRKEDIHQNAARPEALRLAENKIKNKYGYQRDEAVNMFYRRIDNYKRHKQKKFVQDKYKKYESLNYFSKIKLDDKYLNNSKNHFPGQCGELFSYDISESDFINIKNPKNLFDDNLNLDSIIPEIEKNNFSYIEKCGIDSIAYYRPYHFYEADFGIYIKIKQFINTVIDIQQRTKLSLKNSKELALKMLLKHELFHYITELFIAFSEFNQNNFNLYYDYHDIYNSNFRTYKCYEETLANAYIIQSSDNLNAEEFNYLNDFFGRQPGGYREAENLFNLERDSKYHRLEDQILNNNINHSQILNLILNHPLASLYNNGDFNLPVYLVDNTNLLDQRETAEEEIIPYNLIKDILFPEIFNNEKYKTPNNFNIYYEESNTWLYPKKKEIKIKSPDKYYYTDQVELNPNKKYKKYLKAKSIISGM